MNGILARQLALDFCCTPGEVMDGQNHYTVYRRLEGRRRFFEKEECLLKIAAVNGKLLFSGREDVLSRCREIYAGKGAEWFVEPDEMRKLDGILSSFGYRIGSAHPFYIGQSVTPVETKEADICFYEKEQILRFSGDRRFSQAFAFCPETPDVLGVAAIKDGQIVGMAGASADSPTMWQIGIDVVPDHRNEGLAQTLVTLLKNEILRRGILPFYGTSFSHLASQRAALGAGFLPAWVELSTEKAEK